MNSIRARLLVLLLVGLSLVLATGGVSVYVLARFNLTRQFDQSLLALARTISTRAVHEEGRLTFDAGDGFDELVGATRFELRTRSGGPLKRSENLAGLQLPQRFPRAGEHEFDDLALEGLESARAIWLGFRPAVESGDDDDDDEADAEESQLAHAIEIPDDLQVLIVTVAIDRGPLDAALGTMAWALLLCGAVVTLTAVLLVVLGVRWGLAPLGRLTRQLEKLSGESGATPLDTTNAPDELEPVYAELNALFRRIDRTIARERSFAGAAAHELRTPLAELRATAEVAVRWPDAEQAEAALREVLTIGREMEGLVESLLLISRGDRDASETPPSRVDLRPLIERWLTASEATIAEKRLRVRVDLNGDGSVEAPLDAVEIIARNLIDNAVRYTPPDGAIHISAETNGAGDAHTVVFRNGPVELKADEAPRIFEPFFRADAARTDRTHVGLGLTVVELVARASRLRVDAALADRDLVIRLMPESDS
ncbi:MAG: sensor histidine kinase [Phycisphaerales bacterium]